MSGRLAPASAWTVWPGHSHLPGGLTADDVPGGLTADDVSQLVSQIEGVEYQVAWKGRPEPSWVAESQLMSDSAATVSAWNSMHSAS